MAAPKNATLCVRPSLAIPERWSLDYWVDNNSSAACQVTFVTFASVEEARSAAAYFQSTFSTQGYTVQLTESPTNASRETFPAPRESEDEIQKRLAKYLEKSFEPARTFSLANLFQIKNWFKAVSTLATQSPLLLALVTLLILIFRSRLEKLLTALPLEKLLASAIPSELTPGSLHLLVAAPILILLTTLYVHFRRQSACVELNRIRIWILQLTVHFHWDHARFLDLLRKEFENLEYASVEEQLASNERNNPSSLTNILKRLTTSFPDRPPEQAKDLIRSHIRDDFARKIQALAGIAAQPGFRSRDLAVQPLHLLLSNHAVTVILLGLMGFTPDKSSGYAGILASRAQFEKAAKQGVLIALVLILTILLPALIWTTVLAFHISLLLYLLDITASLVTLPFVLTRPLAIAYRHKGLPEGLELHECVGAFKIEVA